MHKLMLICCVLLLAPTLVAADPNSMAEDRLTVGIAECPPFVIIEDGHFSGLAVYLWEQVGREMGLSWEYVEFSLGNMLDTVSKGDKDSLPDVGVSCTSVTAEREELIDFSHSFNETYTAIAVHETSLGQAITGFFTSPTVIRAFFIVLGIAVLIGGTFYLLEHNQNKKLFAHHTFLGRILEPIIIGLMFITNGPIRYYRFKTLTGRVLATLLTLSSTFFIAAVTAVFASSFTLNAMKSDVRSLDDLRNLQVGALVASTSSAFLDEHGIRHETRPHLDALVRDLDEGKLDAIVSDAAFLQYRINRGKQQGRYKSLTVLPFELKAQNYAFVLEEGSPLREGINRSLLTVRSQQQWRDKLREYLGEQAL